MDYNAIMAWAAVAGVIVALLGVLVAWWQLRNLNTTLRMNSLGVVLQLESEMNARKAKADEIAFKIRQESLAENANIKLLDVLNGHLNGCLENWLNAADRLAFCILQGYFADKDWKTEYRGYFADLVKTHPEKYGPGSIYTNTLDLHHRWQRS
jgi:hypothetical protein